MSLPRPAGWFEQHERRIVRLLARAVAGLVVTGLAAANPPSLGTVAPVASPLPATLVAERRVASVLAGSTEPGRAGAEASARALVAAAGGVPVAPASLGPWVRAGDLAAGADRCPAVDLVVSWVEPGDGYAAGAYVAPLGPPPTTLTRRVNGVVLCRSSHHAFVGFEAAYTAGRWLLSVVPSLAEDTDATLLAGEAAAGGATPAGSTDAAAGGQGLPPAASWDGAPLEPLAPYAPQTSCDPTAKPGVLGFRDLLLAGYPGSRNLGIGRACDAEGVSEHKEGRAFDWGVAADDPVERAEVDEVLAWLLGPDPAGEPHAMARRLGLMYVIWDGRIWSSFLAAEGWRPYVGRSDHRDHVHFSFDWAGAQARTSFWRDGRAGVPAGSGAPDLPLRPATPVTLPPALPVPSLPALPLPGVLGPVADTAGTDRADGGSGSSGSAPPPEPPPPTTTTSSPPATTTTAAPPPTTSTTRPPLLTTPTSVRLGSL